LSIYGPDFIFRKIYIYVTITIKTTINFVVKMTKLYISIVAGIVLFSALAPAIYTSGNSIAPIELKGLVWDDDEGIWSNCVSADKGDILRFNVSITYHDPDGEGFSYKIKWITVINTLPEGLEYLGNATIPETNVSADGKTITWSNISDIELFDGDTLSIEFDVRVLDSGLHLDNIEIHAFETCPHVWHTKTMTVVVYTINPPKSRDTDDDGNKEMAFDADGNEGNGYELYIDPDQSSNAVSSIDGDNDSKIDHFIDINGNSLPDRYWDPDDDILCDVFLKDVDHDGTEEWIFDSDGDGRLDRYYDPDDGKIYPYNGEDFIVVTIIKPLKNYLYIDNIKKRRLLFRTVVVGEITVEANVSSNQSIDRVEFYVDEQLMYVDNESPYTWDWTLNPLEIGKRHTLEVKAYGGVANGSAKITVWRYKYNPLLKHPLIVIGGSLLLAKMLKSLQPKEQPSQPPKSKPKANEEPVAKAGGPYSGYVGDAISFDGSASYDSDGSIVSYQWDFGDGKTGSGKTVSHSYEKSGRYTVKLTVTDDDGATSVDEAIVEIQEKSMAQSNIDAFWYAVTGLSTTLLVGLVVLFFRRGLFE